MPLNKRILLIDHDAIFIEALATLIEAKGYSVYSAFTAEDGIAIAHTKHPALIIAEASLRGSPDGVSISDALIASEFTKSIPVILLYISNDRHAREMLSANTNIDAVFEKPPDADTLFETIERLVR